MASALDDSAIASSDRRPDAAALPTSAGPPVGGPDPSPIDSRTSTSDDDSILLDSTDEGVEQQDAPNRNSMPAEGPLEHFTAAERARLEEMATTGSAVSTWVLDRLLRRSR